MKSIVRHWRWRGSTVCQVAPYSPENKVNIFSEGQMLIDTRFTVSVIGLEGTRK